MSKKRPRGRPPFPKGQAKKGRLYCRLLESEVAEIEAAGKRANMTTSRWIREALLAATRAKKAAP